MDPQRQLFAALGWDQPPALVQSALTHPSFRNEVKGRVEDYERLEFLGDAVLQLCVSERLAHAFPRAREGELSRMRSSLVRAETLATFARRVDVGAAIRVGRGARASGERDQTNVLADVVEALVGAAYLDGGLDRARALVDKIVEGKAFDLASLEARDPKSQLQEQIQGEGRPTPFYRVEAVIGPDHDRWFDVAVIVVDEVLAVGRGRSKKLAEQEAARLALAGSGTTKDDT